jgi:hypothetical protein
MVNGFCGDSFPAERVCGKAEEYFVQHAVGAMDKKSLFEERVYVNLPLCVKQKITS